MDFAGSGNTHLAPAEDCRRGGVIAGIGNFIRAHGGLLINTLIALL